MERAEEGLLERLSTTDASREYPRCPGGFGSDVAFPLHWSEISGIGSGPAHDPFLLFARSLPRPQQDSGHLFGLVEPDPRTCRVRVAPGLEASTPLHRKKGPVRDPASTLGLRLRGQNRGQSTNAVKLAH